MEKPRGGVMRQEISPQILDVARSCIKAAGTPLGTAIGIPFQGLEGFFMASTDARRIIPLGTVEVDGTLFYIGPPQEDTKAGDRTN